MNSPTATGDAPTVRYHLGKRFTTDSYTLTDAEIRSFASQYDPQALHLDDAVAAASPFGGIIASGWHTAAITMRLLVTGGVFRAKRAVGAGVTLQWQRAAHVCDVLTVTAEVTDISPSRHKADQCMVTLRVYTLNQRQEVVQSMDAKLATSMADVEL